MAPATSGGRRRLDAIATSAYQRGYEDADTGRRRWRAELAARHAAHAAEPAT